LTGARRAGLLIIEVLAAAAVLGMAVVWPPVSQPTSADAIVLLSGDGSRVPVAVGLMERGVAPTLVFAGQPDTTQGLDLCRGAPFEVICLRPEPDNTRTESRAAARLAGERGWRSLVLVTSKFHMARARLHLKRCFPGSVEMVGGYPPYGWEFARRLIVHEWVGLVHASVLARGC
jgi:uncharacterized SAM-binding protein YcdF (DUF218 family)